MRFDWRYAFHSFWFLQVLMLLMSPVIFEPGASSKELAVGAMLGLVIVDGLFTRQYPYFSRFGRQGFEGLVGFIFFTIIACVAPYFPNWSPAIWGFMSFCVASFGGTLDGYLAYPTEIMVGQTRKQLRRKAEFTHKPIPH